MDTSAPLFDLSLLLYQQQLNKDVVMNIYIDGKWGSYRHLLLDSCATVTVPYAWVNVKTPGDLSSLRWLEGNLDPDRFVLVFGSYTGHFTDHFLPSCADVNVPLTCDLSKTLTISMKGRWR